MQIHSLRTVLELRRLRKQGHSISELMQKFSIPKTTIWHHIRDIKLSHKHAVLIRAKQGGSKIRSKNDWEKAQEKAYKILKGNHKYICSLTAMLYWAEGNKRGFVFTNTDGDMVRLFLFALKNSFGVAEEEIKLTVRIFSNLNKKECIAYWSGVIKLPKQKFYIYLNGGGTKGKAKYGICRISVKKSGFLHKLMFSLIRSILLQQVGPQAPVAQLDRAVPS